MPPPPVTPIEPAGENPIECPFPNCTYVSRQHTTLPYWHIWLRHLKDVHFSENPDGENKKSAQSQDGKEEGESGGSASDARRMLECPYKSQGCKATPKIWANMKPHMLRHKNLSPYCCRYCDWSTPDPSNLKKHERLQHGVSDSQSEPQEAQGLRRTTLNANASTLVAPLPSYSATVTTPALSDAPTFPETSAPTTPAIHPDWNDAPSPSPTQALDATCDVVPRDLEIDPTLLSYASLSAWDTHVSFATLWRDANDAWAVGQAEQEADTVAGSRLEGFYPQSTHAVAAPASALGASSIAQTYCSAMAAPAQLPAQGPPARRARLAQNERFMPYQVPTAQRVRTRSRQEPMPSPIALPRLPPELGAILVPRDGGHQEHVDELHLAPESSSTPASASYTGSASAGDAEYDAYNDLFCALFGEAPAPAPAHHASPGPAPVAPTVSLPTFDPFTALIEFDNARGDDDDSAHMQSPSIYADSAAPLEHSSYGANDELWTPTMLQFMDREDLVDLNLQQVPSSLQSYDDADAWGDWLDLFH